jgi:hypothetical protein
VHKLLDVEKYVPVVPMAPIEELHASSVQHPRFPDMRWLLHTKRVPVLQSTDTVPPSGAAERAANDPCAAAASTRPRCAGIGDADEPVWLCHECAAHLCRQDPKMPPQALANWNWGGRMHPRYQDLTMATRTMLGLGRMVMRLILLKYKGSRDESEKALVGNTILVAQPSPEQIVSALPPSDAEQTSFFNVVYATEKGDLPKHKELIVDREEYLACARLRKERCPLFADIDIDQSKARTHLPEDSVPSGVLHGAIEMKSIDNFSPNLSGPASRRSPFSKGDEKDEDEDNEEGGAPSDDGASEHAQDDVAEDTNSGENSIAFDALIAAENSNA